MPFASGARGVLVRDLDERGRGQELHAHGDPLQSTVLTISCHAYTHVDAPLHYGPLCEGKPSKSIEEVASLLPSSTATTS